MTNPKYFRGVLVVSDIWKSVGYGSIVYLAAISGVSQEQYEACLLYTSGLRRTSISPFATS